MQMRSSSSVGERPFLLGFLQSRFHLFQDKARIMF